jgi:hypothetical protein
VVAAKSNAKLSGAALPRPLERLVGHSPG